METNHRIIFEHSKSMEAIGSNSVDLIVTSPPYPMIEMWDDMFIDQNPEIGKALTDNQGLQAFELMHKELDHVWKEVYRILRAGGIACINIGDATRTLDGNFALYPNHSRILKCLHEAGFSALPTILWRKQTNAPNKFMGSGMLPPGAYVTLEHESILILRKGPKRVFKNSEENSLRRESSYFWEERNGWFSDIWFDLKGTGQDLDKSNMRLRSASFPFELPYRLINMFSIKGDTVVDPFSGAGTTMFASMTSGRNSFGYEIDSHFQEMISEKIDSILTLSNQRIRDRINKHTDFLEGRAKEKGPLKHKNKFYGFPVVTSQEKELYLNELVSIKRVEKNSYKVVYSDK